MIHAVTLPDRGAFAAWRDAARRAISHRIAPDRIDWQGGGLLAGEPLPDRPGPHRPRVPAAFLALAESVGWHTAPERFALLYQALWRLDAAAGDPLSQADPLGRRLHLMAKAVARDIHKMHAFVRFQELPADGARRSFGAWFEPTHDTLEPGSVFFVKRFSDMDWMISTPRQTAVFRDGALRFGPGGPRPDLPEDASGALWATYFRNIFNPARIKTTAMRSEMPLKYWKNLPETRLIPDMLAEAPARVARMHEAAAQPPRPGAASVSARYRAAMPRPEVPVDLPSSLEAAQAAAQLCTRCALCATATRTVWGEGPAQADLMIVGEQPGDHEDLAGRPFVGPAGQVLRQAMARAGMDPGAVWLTNAVKHFKFTPRGRQRLHQTPDRAEILACRWWIGLKLALVQPRLTLALGATAAFALTGREGPHAARVGTVETGLHDGPVRITWHPSYLLRLPEGEPRDAALHQLIADLRAASQAASAT